MENETYISLNKAWKSTCKVILGQEIGELKEYEAWLSEHQFPILKKKSSLSGKDVYCAVTDYGDDAKFISLDEANFDKKFEPLTINEIKDIDSVVQSVSERFQYCGNIVLGNSKFVEKSSDVQNSFYALGSNFIYDSEYVAYSSNCRGSKYLFGVVSDYGCSNLIRVFETYKQSRCIEAWKCYSSSDCYFSSCVQGSRDVMFSFNQRNKKNMIGNIELTKDKFIQLKDKLLAELVQELLRNKRLPSLMEMVSASAKPMKLPRSPKTENYEGNDKTPIEEAFQNTTHVLFGKKLYGFESYGDWLRKYVPAVVERKSVASGKKMYVSDINPCNLFPSDRLIDLDEYWEIGEMTKLEESEVESLEEIRKSIGKIGFVNPNGRLGETKNLMLVPLCNTSVNCFYCCMAAFDENVAYSYWPRTSKYMFGCALAFSSNFCINSYYSMNLSRAFEVDDSNNCSDLYFSHNCENVRDSMFCFNTKNLKCAIGNATLAVDKYKSIKSSLLSQVYDELEKKKDFKWSIFNLSQ